MSPLALAWRGLARQPARAALGVLGIAAVGALLFDMLLLSRGLVISFRDLLDSVGFDVRVTATEALPSMGPVIEDASDVVEALRALPEIDEVVPLCFGDATLRGAPSGVYFIGTGPRPRQNWTLLRGEDLPESFDPESPAPLIVNERLADSMNVSPGDVIELRVAGSTNQLLPPMDYRVTGVAEFRFDSSDALSVATTLPAFFRAHGEDDRDAVDLLLVSSSSRHGATAAVAAIRAAFPDLHAFSNEQFIARFQRRQFSYFRQISFALTTVTLFFAFLLVTTLLTVSVNQRFAEIASLRALGFARRRIVADLLCESALFVGAGGVLAVPLGWALAGPLDTILRGMPGLPEKLHFFVFEPRALLLHVALLSLTGVLAAFYPVFLAARLPIAATLRKETVS